MNKLTKFSSSRARSSGRRRAGVVRVSTLSDADYIAVTPPAPLVGAWTIDPETGRLVCSWTEPHGRAIQCLARDAGEPPSALPIAA